MHETGIVRDLLRRILEAATSANAEKVTAVEVRLGALTGFSPAHFRDHFAEEATGTLADGAELRIDLSEDLADGHALDVMVLNIEMQTQGPVA